MPISLTWLTTSPLPYKHVMYSCRASVCISVCLCFCPFLPWLVLPCQCRACFGGHAEPLQFCNCNWPQVITLDYDKYERELNNIPKSHSKSIQARDNMKLRPVRSEAPKSDLKARLPKLYRALAEDTGVTLILVALHQSELP